MRSTRLRSPRPDVPTWVHPRCDCGKVLTLDRDDAKRWYGVYANHNGHFNAVRYYRCQYGTWHWTSQLEPRKETHQP